MPDVESISLSFRISSAARDYSHGTTPVARARDSPRPRRAQHTPSSGRARTSIAVGQSKARPFAVRSGDCISIHYTMSMGDADDFTFCQVSPPPDDDHLEMPKSFPNIKRISLDDNHLHSAGILRVNDSLKDDRLCDDATSKDLVSNASPSNNINEMSPQPSKFSLKEAQTPKAARDVGDSLSDSQDQKFPSKKPAVRAKVPFEKGYSQMDWLKLTRTNPDLAGLKGQSNRRLISKDEVRKHKTEGSVWTVLKGHVYNISPYMKFHPGGGDMLMKAAGKDCTSLFNKYHAWVNAEFLLEKCLVGVLDESS